MAHLVFLNVCETCDMEMAWGADDELYCPQCNPVSSWQQLGREQLEEYVSQLLTACAREDAYRQDAQILYDVLMHGSWSVLSKLRRGEQYMLTLNHTYAEPEP